MTEVTRGPVASTTNTSLGVSPLTVVGAASVHAALADSSDVTYVTTSTSPSTARAQMSDVKFASLALPAGAVIEWVKPVVREAHTGTTYLTVYLVYARSYDGFPHSTANSRSPIGSNPGDNVFRTTDGPVFTKASDGVKWHTLDPSTFSAQLLIGPANNFPTSTITPPKMAKIDLVVSYRVAPTVTSITPAAGSTGDTQPAVSWLTGETQEAYRVVVVTPSQQDSSGRTPGSVGYDPSTVAQPVWDSGKVYSATQSAVVTNHLDNGSGYFIYVRSWAPAVNNVEMASAWTTAGQVNVANLNIASPSIMVADDVAAYTLKVTVTRVAPSGGEVAPLYYTLQRQADDGTWADVAGATQLSGPGEWQYYDPLAAPGNNQAYRVRGVYVTASNKQVGSPWVEVTGMLVDRHQWWLRDRVDSSLNQRLSVASHQEIIPKPQEVAYGAGARAATVTHQGVRASRHQVVLRAPDASSLADLRALIDTGRTLVLVTAFGHTAQVQVGESVDKTLVKAQPLTNEQTPIRNYHMLGLELIEVEQ